MQGASPEIVFAHEYGWPPQLTKSLPNAFVVDLIAYSSLLRELQSR